MSGKEVARWSHSEVRALLRAWREGLEQQPEPLRRGKLNSYVSARFHELRAAQPLARTACSIVYKKKYWRSMVQFICAYNRDKPNGDSDWYALTTTQRRALFEQRKTTSYKFTDLDERAAREIAELIALEDNTPGLADLVGGGGRSGSSRNGMDDSSDDDYDDNGGSSSAGLDDDNDEIAVADTAADAAALSLLRHSKRERAATGQNRNASATSSEDGDGDANSEGSDNSGARRRHSTRSARRSNGLPSSQSSGSHASIAAPGPRSPVNALAPSFQYPHERRRPSPLQTSIPARGRDDLKPTRSPSPQTATAELLAAAAHLAQQARALQTLVVSERTAGNAIRTDLLTQLKQLQQAAVADAQQQHSERIAWTDVAVQLTRETQMLEAAQAASASEQATRHALVRAIQQSQHERMALRDAWAVDSRDRKARRDELERDSVARETEWTHVQKLAERVQHVVDRVADDNATESAVVVVGRDHRQCEPKQSADVDASLDASRDSDRIAESEAEAEAARRTAGDRVSRKHDVSDAAAAVESTTHDERTSEASEATSDESTRLGERDSNAHDDKAVSTGDSDRTTRKRSREVADDRADVGDANDSDVDSSAHVHTVRLHRS